MRAARAPVPAAARASPGLIAGLIRLAALTVAALALALMSSIVLEWIGMVWWWPEQGAAHSLAMLEAELGFLGASPTTLIAADPPATAGRALDLLHRWLWRTAGLLDAVTWMVAEPPADAGAVRRLLHGVAEYAVAALTITEVFVVRLVILVLSSPVFGLFALVGITDGLVERDLRRWSGGRESSYRFHIAKQFIAPAILVSWSLYLALPVTFHPGLVILPFAAAFALALRVTIASFKKYV